MKKLFKILVILSIVMLFISCGREVTSWEAKEALSKHLIERYGEEFEIGYMGRRSDGKEVWYEAEIYPSKYVGTVKEYDKYYRESGTVNIEKGILGEKLGKTGDTYGIVKVNESAEKFYEKKLKELFGDNVLQVYDIWFNRILDDYSFENIIRVSDEERTALIIKGGIYIFGRVESDEDREWYRKQIYEFIQFMKETGTFEYVRLSFYIIDERMLVEGAEKCFENIKYKSKTRRGITEEIDKILNPMTKKYEILTKEEKERKLESFNKKNIDKEIRGILLLAPIGSIKYIENNYFTNEEILKIFGRKKLYDNLEDVQFKYEEFAIKEVKN